MTYVFEKDDKKYRSVGITHWPQTFGRNNMPLTSNPQKGHFEPSYIRNGIINKRIGSYCSKVNNNYMFSVNDFRNVKSKIRNYKKRRKYKKNKYC